LGENLKRIKRISTRNAEFQVVESLKTNRSKRTKLRQGFIEGIESIKQALAADIVISRIIYAKGRELSDWALNLIESLPIESVIEMDPQLYHDLCDREEPSEIIATFEYPNRDISDARISDDSIFLLFDRPSDKGNLGSIIRTANSFGVDGIFILGHGVDPFDPKVIRSSLGGVFHTPVYHITSMDSLLNWLTIFRGSHAGSMIGSDSSGDRVISQAGVTTPVVLVLGNEAKGMSKSIQESCDAVVQIPGQGNVNSLNVACAGSILLWELYKSKMKFSFG
jgi:tRNA G18 (ribose-2'-O)-methylase SpoU